MADDSWYSDLEKNITIWAKNVKSGVSYEIDEMSISKASDIIPEDIKHDKLSILLYLTSLNLLNAAIKTPQYKHMLSYRIIKTNAIRVIEAIEAVKDNSVSCYYNKVERCLYFQIGNIIFSFHEVPMSLGILKASFNKPIKWGGVRLQKIASPIFDTVISKFESDNYGKIY